MAAVKAFTGRALELLSEPAAGAEVARLLQRVSAAGDKMDTMANELASMLRVAGQEVHLQNCDVTALVRDIAREARNLSSASDLIEIRVADNLHANADLRLLRIAFENLMSNAIKFSSGRQTPIVEVGSAPAEGHEIVLFVRDNGCGFDPAFADKLFKPFSRLHSQTEFPGIGLGLSIACRIAVKHRGRMWAESSPGDGATFYFSLPV